MKRRSRDRRAGLRPALWLVVDAGLAALIAWPAEALLLFLLNPDLPFTPGGFAATLVALAPQAVVVFVLAGPGLTLLATSLSVGRSTRRGLSARNILRFGLLDALLLAAAAIHQWRSLKDLLPDPARTALALTATALAVVVVTALALTLYDLRRPRIVGAPWLIALALAALVPLAVAGDLRRVRPRTPTPVVAPSFEPTRPLLLVEIPGLAPADLDAYLARGNTPSLEALVARGALFQVDGRPLADPVALHATLITGQGPLRHGILAGVRRRPATGQLGFAIFPRGLLLRPLLLTPLWERVPSSSAAVQVVALPGIAQALGQRLALIGDPLAWPTAGDALAAVPGPVLAAGAEVRLAGLNHRLTCAPSPLAADQFFDPPAEELPTTPPLGAAVTAALREDLCALGLARHVLLQSAPPMAVVVRLAGHGRTAWTFAGWRGETPARGASEQEIAAYGRTLTRYVRALDVELGRLMEAAGRRSLIALVAPMGVRARQDLGRVGSALIGRTGPTGAFTGPPLGVAVVAGEGVQSGRPLGAAAPLTAVLPTLLWGQGLPAAEDMGPILRDVFTPEFTESHPVVTLPSYAEVL